MERVYQHRKMLLARLQAAKTMIEVLMSDAIKEGHVSFALQDIAYIIDVVKKDIEQESNASIKEA